jgi:hypothetical protein
MPNGNAPNDLAADIGDQERRRDATRWQINRKTFPLKQVDVVDPCHALAILQPELEPIVRHGAVRCHERAFVACS